MSYNERWTFARLSQCYRIINVVVFSNSLIENWRKKEREKKPHSKYRDLDFTMVFMISSVVTKPHPNAWVSVRRLSVGLHVLIAVTCFSCWFFSSLNWFNRRAEESTDIKFGFETKAEKEYLNSNTIADCWSLERISNQFLSENFKPEILKWSLSSHFLFTFNRNCLSIPLS